jgi:hypothetical protein
VRGQADAEPAAFLVEKVVYAHPGDGRDFEALVQGSGSGEIEEPVAPPPERAAPRRRWANLIRA